MEHEQLTEQIIGCAMRVHSALGPGYLEAVYDRALLHELRKSGLRAECEIPLRVIYDHIVVGDFIADLFVEETVIVENKAVQFLAAASEAQLVNYLAATGVEIGLLFNFGADRLQFKRKHRTYRPPAKV
jgi:GxxExxY protein